MTQRIFVDSNVLASRTLRDWLFLLRTETYRMFQLHTSFDVLMETVRVTRRRHPTADGKLTADLFHRLEDLLDEVLGDFDGSVDFSGPDVNDHHVHAAVLSSRADKLLTSNERHFPETDDLTYEVYTPDEFLVLVDDSAPHHVRSVTRQQIDYWQGLRSEGKQVRPLGHVLVDAGCPDFGARIVRHVKALSGA